jgi:hypothetical protein
LHLESSSEGRYDLRTLVYLALAGKRATADRIRVQKAIPVYLEVKGNGPVCGVSLRVSGPYVVGGRLVYRNHEIRENCSGKRAQPALCCSHGGSGMAGTGWRPEEASVFEDEEWHDSARVLPRADG